MKRCAVLFLVASVALSTPAMAQLTPTNAAVHDQLSAVKDRLVAAVNKRDEAALLAELDPSVSFTAMNNETFHGTAGAKAYFDRMMVRSSRIVEDMSLSAKPDDYSILYASDSAAVSTGMSNAHFKIRGGTEFDVPLRWTATLVKNGNGWKIASAHFSANMFDNPIMNEVKRLTWWIAGGAGLIGLLVGWLLGRMRRKPA
jgi:ketosteroid isomerase-like protein